MHGVYLSKTFTKMTLATPGKGEMGLARKPVWTPEISGDGAESSGEEDKWREPRPVHLLQSCLQTHRVFPDLHSVPSPGTQVPLFSQV